MSTNDAPDFVEATARLKAAIDADDFEQVKALMTERPELHRAPLGYGKNGPLTWAAECRVPRRPPGEARLTMARWMIEHGSDIHQGGDGPLMRAALADERLPMTELLLSHGADVNALWGGHYPILWAPCETLAPKTLRRLIAAGAELDLLSTDRCSPTSMVLATYCRDAKGRNACLEVLAEAGVALPDTPTLALHRGRLDLLQAHLDRDPALLSRRFSEAEIYPIELGVGPGDGLSATPVDGATLLHLAIEFDDLDVARWLLERGADPNARALIDAEGFGGHTPLFHAVVTLAPPDAAPARLLLDHAADPNLRATFRKQLRDMGDPEKENMREFHDVAPLEYARQFQEPRWVNGPAIDLVAERGGRG